MLEKEYKSNTGFLLGVDEHGEKFYMSLPSWDCKWYWGFGYLVSSHTHLNPDSYLDIVLSWNSNKPILKELTISEKEAWKLCELYKRFLMFQDLAAFYHRGGMHISYLNDGKKDLEKWKEINTNELPEIMGEMLKLVAPEKFHTELSSYFEIPEGDLNANRND